MGPGSDWEVASRRCQQSYSCSRTFRGQFPVMGTHEWGGEKTISVFVGPTIDEN